MIRVCHVIGAMERAGAETFLMNLYRSIDRTKVQFDFLVHSDKPAAYDDEIQDMGGKIFHAPSVGVHNFVRLYSFYRKFFHEHPEHRIVHGHIGSMAPLYLKAAKSSNCFTIAHSHAQKYPLTAEELLFRVMAFPTRYIADHYFGASYQAGVDRYGKLIAKSNKFDVIMNGIDPARYLFSQKMREECRKNLNIEANQKVIGHVARLEPIKNQEFLLDVFECVLKEYPDAILLIVGGGSQESQLKKIVVKKNIGRSVKFLGVRTDIPEILMASDIFTMTSFTEGLSVSTIEAQATGLPCVVSSGFPEIVKCSDAVQFLDLDRDKKYWSQKIIEVFKEVSSYPENEIRQQGNVNVSENGFNIEVTARWIEDFYTKNTIKI